MQIRLIALSAVALLAVASMAFAAEAARDPMRLALTKADFPAKAERWGGKVVEAKKLALLFAGARGKAYITTFRFPSGKKSEYVEDIVIDAGNRAQARATFASLKKAHVQPLARTTVRLPSFGDEQLAVVVGDIRNDEAGGWIVVRKDTIVWELDIETDPTAQDFGFSKAQVLAELQKYAAKQKRRIGSG